MLHQAKFAGSQTVLLDVAELLGLYWLKGSMLHVARCDIVPNAKRLKYT